MSKEDGKPHNDDDYFGIKADHDHTPPAGPPVGSNSAPPASANSANSNTTNTTTNATGTETGGDKGATTPTTPKEDGSSRGHKDSSKRAHKERDSSRRGQRGHKESNRERDHGGHIEDHNRKHTPRNQQPPPGTNSSVMDDLEEMECYHGNILEDEVKTVLNKHGDYILRMAVDKDGKGIMVTIIWNEETVNIPVRAKNFETEGGKEYLYTLDSKTRCPTIKDLIRKHTMMSIPVMRNKMEIWLLNPIAKQSWELRPENVYSGKLRLPLKKFCNVAVKVIKRSANTEAATMELQKEAAIMRKLKHVNIVRFFGMVVKKDTIMVVMELINGGGLDKYLKKFPETSPEERTGFAVHIAAGLAYLHGQGVMHRDVACRNCLLDMYRKVAKVSDFGLARTGAQHKLRPEERIPIRWTAPEVVKTYIYTQKADIYAYAILVYEIFSNAALPFDGYTNAQIKDQIHTNTFRPKFPENTPQKVIEVISMCWHGDPAQRPPLIDVCRVLSGLAPRCEDEPERANKKEEGNKGTSREKLSKAKVKRSNRSKERNPRGGGGKSREMLKSVKSGRTKREGREGKSRERTD
ncbi:hypothetical protein PRIPAC_82130 [Pristionchus pacificus]|uniref:Tyrosine-protein kinase n=1 Tax=Pristionchus pacificus TaxID=54126 RepID=A0A2A6BX83_PRIPA|nr:hypothetical protein PRIPAC_82130 [Pristionchus pacificus]|eukprot:PDM70524.1 protein kinase [Pristionchus pacificus]